MDNDMPIDNMSAEELIQYVWISTSERTPLELRLAEVINQLLGELEDGENFGAHD